MGKSYHTGGTISGRMESYSPNYQDFYYWDVQVTDASGITTVEVGVLTIDRDITV